MACFYAVLPVWCWGEFINLEELVGSDSLKTKLKNTLIPKAFHCEIGPGIYNSTLYFKND